MEGRDQLYMCQPVVIIIILQRIQGDKLLLLQEDNRQFLLH